MHASLLQEKKSFRNLDFILDDPAETDFDDFRSDYLGEYEAICGKVSAC
jgi:hypothetical protein